MKFSYNWLNSYFENKLPSPDELAGILTKHTYEVEEVSKEDGDYLIDIDILPNRSSDSMSHRGVAREIAVLLDLDITNDPNQGEFTGDETLSSTENITLNVEDSALVRRAMKRLAIDVSVGDSPDWLKERLGVLGQRSINNIVDITNLVMLETGQPVHAFDREKIKGEISIRKARDGEKIKTLDGAEFELDSEMLVIADEEKALDIAGIKGGIDSGIDENTKEIVLSVCNFHPGNIRKTSQKLNLRTDASKRFEQEITPELAPLAMDSLSGLVTELASGRVSADVVDFYPRVMSRYVGGFSVTEANKLLGADLSDVDVESILDRLKKHAGFEWKKVKPIDDVLSKAPQFLGKKYKYGASFSFDAPELFDCSSFVAYLFAHAGARVPRMTIDQLAFGEEITKEDLKPGDLIFSRNQSSETAKFEDARTGEELEDKQVRNLTREFLPGTDVGEGVDHNGIYLGDGKVIHASGKWHKGEVLIENLDETPAFKNIVGYRRMAKNDERYVVTVPYERLDLRATRSFYVSGTEADFIEEIGRIYGFENIGSKLPESKSDILINKKLYYTTLVRNFLRDRGFSEVYLYSHIAKGELELLNPLAKGKEFLRTELSSGIHEKLDLNLRNLDILGLDFVKIFEIGTVFDEEDEKIHIALGIKKAGKQKGVDDMLEETLSLLGDLLGIKIDARVKEGVVEFDFGKIIESLPNPDSYKEEMFAKSSSVQYEAFSVYPAISRDIAMWVPEDIEEFTVEELIRDKAGELLLNMRLFDKFEKDGRVSYAYRLVFQSMERTLTDDEINKIMDEVYRAVSGKGFEVR